MKIGVIYLYRFDDDIYSMRSFLDSYKKNPAGYFHELCIILKGKFQDKKLKEIDQILADIEHRLIRISDKGRDISAYRNLSNLLKYEILFFLNSHSIILNKNWLLSVAQPFDDLKVGLVGTSASFASHLTMAKESLSQNKLSLRWFKLLMYLPILNFLFKRFPNPHIRTNGFAIRRNLFKTLKYSKYFLRCRLGSYAAESGKSSITNQILKKGYRVFLVGENVEEATVESWGLHDIFWTNQQEKLIILDNQSKLYQYSSLEGQNELMRKAWGIK